MIRREGGRGRRSVEEMVVLPGLAWIVEPEEEVGCGRAGIRLTER